MESPVSVASSLSKPAFLLDAVEACGRRIVVRHVNERRYSPEQGCLGLAVHVGFLSHSGLSEMDMCVDAACHQDISFHIQDLSIRIILKYFCRQCFRADTGAVVIDGSIVIDLPYFLYALSFNQKRPLPHLLGCGKGRA